MAKKKTSKKRAGKKDDSKNSKKKDGKQTEESEEERRKKELESQKETLKNFLLVMGIIVGTFIIVFAAFYLTSHFSYRGVSFEKTNMGELTFYRTVFPGVNSNNQKVDYYIYLRNHPTDLEKEVPFNGTLNLEKNIIFDFEEQFLCDGDGGVAFGTFVRTEMFGLKIYQDENATCGQYDKSIYIKVQPTNQTTNIQQTGRSCYDFNVNNCEIIPVTERFMIEMFVQVQEYLDS